jgi:hypothetical protein
MFDCSDDVLAFHNDDVTLPLKEREEMRARRKAVRERLKAGLEKASNPLPLESKSQGSYAMKTMTQDPDKDYDIDDGVYFEKAALVGTRGADMSSLEARQMVRDAVDDGSFKIKPEVRPNCVRVLYDARGDEGPVRQGVGALRTRQRRLETLGCQGRHKLVRQGE